MVVHSGNENPIPEIWSMAIGPQRIWLNTTESLWAYHVHQRQLESYETKRASLDKFSPILYKTQAGDLYIWGLGGVIKLDLLRFYRSGRASK